MIIVLKGRNRKQIIIKVVSMVSLVAMFGFYYLHMSDKFKALNNQSTINVKNKSINKNLSKSIKLENTIFKESKIIAKLLGQKNIKYIKVVNKRLLISCDYNTDIEPLIVRYGVKAMIKKTTKDIKIAIDLAIIVENKYDS